MIRSAVAMDLAAIMRLERSSFPTDAWSEAMMREELASPHNRYLVLDEAGRLAGYAGLRAPVGARDGDVQTIAIEEAARGRGQGRALLRALLTEASERGIREVFLEVRADNPVAQTLYRSEGFADVGRRPRYYQPDDVDALVMRIDVPGWAAAQASITQAESSGQGAEAPAGGDLPELCAPEHEIRPTTTGKGWC